MLTPRPTTGDASWFTHDRFGLYLHWGLYALPARHEWVQNWEEIAPEIYRHYFDHFSPDLYDPHAWARAARDAGMRYVVVTTKHHDGFCLWDSRHTDFKATNTPFGKDLLRPLVEAFRAEDIRIGFYYSLIDWHHPEFPIDCLHPQRNHPDALDWNATRDVRKYAAYMRDQVRELLTDFGSVDLLFFDFTYPGIEENEIARQSKIRPGSEPIFALGKRRVDWESDALYALIRELSPHILLNNRLDLPASLSDYQTPEQIQPQEWVRVDGEPVVWETCQTFSGSWGYHRDESSWKSPEQLIRMLIDTASCGGNLLMNVGPTARGTFDPRALDALSVYRDWMHLHSRCIYGCTQSDFAPAPGCVYTQSADGKRLYVAVYAWPFQQLHLPGLAGKVVYAQLLNDASEIRIASEIMDGPHAGQLTLSLPVRKPEVTVPVIELFLRGV